MAAATNAPSQLARTHRAVLMAAAVSVTLLGWAWMAQGAGHHVHGMVAAVLMWQAMTLAMMTPATLTWLFAFAALAERSQPGRKFAAIARFAAGYYTVWLGYSVACAALQLALQRSAFLEAGKLPRSLGAAVLIGAGIVQLTPLHGSCLRHCRNPLTYFLSRWRGNSALSGFRFGAVHGAYCLGCCWALMLTAFAMGVMNTLWMVLLTVLVCVEKLAPAGARVATITGALFLVCGAALLF